MIKNACQSVFIKIKYLVLFFEVLFCIFFLCDTACQSMGSISSYGLYLLLLSVFLQSLFTSELQENLNNVIPELLSFLFKGIIIVMVIG